jgi:hypothetical protein
MHRRDGKREEKEWMGERRREKRKKKEREKE